MVKLRRVPSLALILGVSFMLTSQATAAQTAAEAKQLLRKGVALCRTKNFTPAKDTLAQVDSALLSAGNRRTLAEYLTQASNGAKQQAADGKIFADAQAAMKAGKFADAKAAFQKIVNSRFLPEATLAEAKAQLAQAESRIAKPDGAAKPDRAAKPDDDGADTTASKRLIALLEARRREIRKYIAEGKKLLAAQDPENALISFEKALALDPENTEAKALRSQAKTAIELKRRTAIIDETRARRRIQKQIADLKFDKAMDRALGLLNIANTESDFKGVAEQLRIARDVLAQNESLYNIEELREKRRAVETREAKLQADHTKWKEVQAEAKRRQLEEAKRKREERIRLEKERKLDTLTNRARALIRKGRYKQADEELTRIIAIDPDNNWALTQKETLTNFIVLIDEKGIIKEDMYQTQQSMVEIRRSEIPWWELLRYPADWKELTLRRKRYAVGAAAESEADREVRHRLKQKLPKLDFPSVPFELVVQFLREVGGVSIYVNWRALQVASVDKSTEVNVHLVDVSLEKALRIILDDVSGAAVGSPTQVDFVVDEWIIRITTREALSHRTYTRVYDIRDIIIPTPTINMPRRIGLQGMTGRGSGSGYGGNNRGGSNRSNRGGMGGGRGGGIGGGGMGGGGMIGGGMGVDEDQPEDKSQEELLNEIVELIKETIARDTWEQEAAIRPMGGQLVVTQTAENHQALLDLIGQLREAKALQIAIEARFIAVTSGFLNSIGLDLDLYFNLDSGLGGGGFVEDPVTGAVVPQLGNSTWGNNPNVWRGGNSVTPIGVIQGSDQGLGVFPQSGMAGNIGGNAGTDAISIGGTFLDDIQVNFLLRATQMYNKTKTLTAPRITLLNGQAATLNIQTETSYIEDIETENDFWDTGVGGGGRENQRRDYQIGVYQEGTSLFVRGTVSADRRYVTMTIVPQVQSLVSMETIPTEFNEEGETIAFLQLPTLSVTTLVTTVSVPDRGTLLLGGQKLAGEVEQEKGVPVLSKVPFLNRLFTNREMVRDERTLLILVKPQIIIQREEEELRFE